MSKTHSGAGWLTPPRLLLLFCLTAILLFSDRGCVSSNSVNGARATSKTAGYGIQGDFDLDLFRDGLVAAALMLGLMLATPTAALLSKRVSSMRLIGAGLGCWAAGTAATGLAPNFPLLLLARVVVGCGNGPFIAVAAPLIDDCAPREQRSLFLAGLFLCFPTGFALGYIYGGLVGSAWGWRAAFLIETAAMAPLCALCLLGPALDMKRSVAPGTPLRLGKALAADLRSLLYYPAPLLTILAIALYNGALGCYSYYGPKAARDVFSLDPETGDLLFGAITVATGVLGTLSGGVALDCVGASVRNALALCTWSVAVATCLVALAFATAHALLPFTLAFGVGEWAMFIMAAPSAAVLLWSVPPDLRPFALSVSEVMQHLVGDIPSPPLIGWLQGKVGNWRLTMCVCTGLLGASALLFAVARCTALGAVHYRDVVTVEEEGLVVDGAVEGQGQGGLEGGEIEGRGGGEDLAQGLLAGEH